MNATAIVKVACVTLLLTLLPGCRWFWETKTPEPVQQEAPADVPASATESTPKGEIICTSEAQLADLTKTGNVLVDCSATWCGPCQMLAPIFEKVALDTANVTFVKVDVDQVPMKDLRGVPTLIFYKDGTEIARKTGSLNEEALRDLIKTTFAL